MDDYPVKLGSILFTLVEPHPDHVVAYNRWYERDHFYAGCLVGPGILAGKRWVATKPLKDLRVADEAIARDTDTGSYLATYWIERGQSVEWGAWAAREVHRLHREGRMFPHRDHVHTKMYRYEGGVFRDPDGVPPELALDHGYAGAIAIIAEASDADVRPALLEWYRSTFLPDALAGSRTAMALLFTPIPIPDDAPADVPRVPSDDRRVLVLAFCDEDPAREWSERFAKHGAEVVAGRLLWGGPFIPTVPGTDRYTDELW